MNAAPACCKNIQHHRAQCFAPLRNSMRCVRLLWAQPRTCRQSGSREMTGAVTSWICLLTSTRAFLNNSDWLFLNYFRGYKSHFLGASCNCGTIMVQVWGLATSFLPVEGTSWNFPPGCHCHYCLNRCSSIKPDLYAVGPIGEDYGFSADIWSLGLCVFELASGLVQTSRVSCFVCLWSTTPFGRRIASSMQNNAVLPWMLKGAHFLEHVLAWKCRAHVRFQAFIPMVAWPHFRFSLTTFAIGRLGANVSQFSREAFWTPNILIAADFHCASRCWQRQLPVGWNVNAVAQSTVFSTLGLRKSDLWFGKPRLFARCHVKWNTARTFLIPPPKKNMFCYHSKTSHAPKRNIQGCWLMHRLVWNKNYMCIYIYTYIHRWYNCAHMLFPTSLRGPPICVPLVCLPPASAVPCHTILSLAHLLRTAIANSVVECIWRAKTIQLHLTGTGGCLVWSERKILSSPPWRME